MQANTIGHAHFPFMRSVRDQNVHKIAVADGSTWHIAVTTPCNGSRIFDGYCVIVNTPLMYMMCNHTDHNKRVTEFLG